MATNLGLRSELPQACREVLRGGSAEEPAVAAHLASCASCAERWRVRSASQAMLAARPATPTELASSSGRRVLERIHQRVVEAAEAAPIAGDLASLPQSDSLPGELWPDFVASEDGSSEVAHRWLRSSAVAQPDAMAWSRVRRSILEDVAPAQRRHWPVRWMVPLASVAAAGVVSFLVFSFARSDMPRSSSSVADTIVFLDLDRPPDVEFAIVRYGDRR